MLSRFALATAAIGLSISVAHAQSIGVVPFQQGLILNRGLDALSGLPRSACVEGGTVEVPVNAVSKVAYNASEVVSTADLLSSLRVQASAGLNTALFSASAELDYVSTSRIRAFEASLFTHVSVKLRWKLVTNF